MVENKKNKPNKKISKKKIPKKKTKETELFEVKKEGKEKIIKKEVEVETPIEKPNQSKHQKKVLTILMLSCLGIILLIVGGYYYIDSLRYSDYDGVEFTTVSEGDLIFYKTSVPVSYKGKVVPYNFYLRTKPNELSKIDFDREEFKLMKFAVLNFTDEFDCNDGDEVIAIANLKKVHDILGIEIMNDPNAKCDSEGRYNYYNLMKADQTEIEKIGPNCYNVKISDCEILKATEKIMAEMFYRINQDN